MKNFFIVVLALFSVLVSYLYLNHIEIDTIVKDTKQDSNKDNLQHDLKSASHVKNIAKVKDKKSGSTIKKNRQVSKKIPDDAFVVKLPEVPKVEAKVPKVVTIGSSYNPHDDVPKVLSMDIPVVKKKEVKKSLKAENKTVLSVEGLPHLDRVSTYLSSNFSSLDDVKKRLQKGGFKVLSTLSLDDKDHLKVIIFTNDLLRKMALKSPFIASLRILLDTKSKSLSITNPYYFARAYMRDKFDEKGIESVLNSLNTVFTGLKNSSDKLKLTLLPEYKFMFGMPDYDDMIVVGKVKDANRYKNNKSVAFFEKISNNRYLLGVNLTKQVANFYNDIGRKNAFVLPYPIVISDGVIKILNPKYYIALCYPMLKMSQFMKISSIPDKIEQQCKNIFK